MSRNVTLAEVAQAAGVSISTVSRIVNGSAGVKDAKAERVRDAIQRLGYRPNTLARSLVTGRSNSIGVLTQDIASPHYGATLIGIERGLGGTAYSPLFISGHWLSTDEERAVDSLLDRRVAGLIVLGGTLSASDLRRLAAQLPLAVLGHQIELSDLGGISVKLDNHQPAYDMTAHLLGRGHRRIGFIMGPEDHSDAQQRRAGYRAALEAYGLTFEESLVVNGDFNEGSGQVATQLLLRRHPELTAIFASNDQMAYGARLALHRLGLRVPDDISLVGFDDLPGTSFMIPPLTTVRQPMQEIGEWLAKSVVARLSGEEVAPLEVQMSLQFRESVANWRN